MGLLHGFCNIQNTSAAHSQIIQEGIHDKQSTDFVIED
jgi:hypothetical protein